MKVVEDLRDAAGNDDISRIILRIVGDFVTCQEEGFICQDTVCITRDKNLFDAYLRAGQVHVNLAAAACFLFGLMNILQHAFPYILVVVGAVDAGHIHSGPDEAAYELIICSRFGRHSDHDIGKIYVSMITKNQVSIV